MNPWLGLASYSEESLNNYHFYGRDKSIETLVRKIKDNLFVTLYGRSGIGKSSLLQAGVIPVLKKEGYYPVVIRFDTTDKEEPLARILWTSLTDALSKAGIEFKLYGKEYEPDFEDVHVLRMLFASGVFLKEEREIIPVMIFDQFEEILYRQPEKSRLLLQQLYAMIDDNLDINLACQEWQDDTNFRIVISIREDDLYLLEDTIDTLNLEDFKENRYRLLPLTPEEAREIIMKPAPEVFKSDEIEEIADEIIAQSSSNVTSQINTIMLSLLCFLLYEKNYQPGKTVTLDNVKTHRENLLESYYLEVTKDLPKEEKNYLEDNLIDESGRRSYIYLSDLKEHAPHAEKYLLDSRDKLLNLNQERVEYVHDQLAQAIARLKSVRTRKTYRTIWTWILGIVLYALLLVSLSFFPRGIYDYRIVDIDNIHQSSKERPVKYLESEGLDYITKNTVVEHIISSKNDVPDKLYVADCPNLKSIVIRNKNLKLEVVDCPSLVNIWTPEDYDKKIPVGNCPNLKEDSRINNDHRSHVSKRAPQYLLGKEIYDSENKTLLINSLNGIINFTTDFFELNDNEKRQTTLYVPFGYKDRFQILKEYSGFKEIKELKLRNSWFHHMKVSYGWFGDHIYALIAVILIIVILFVTFPQFTLFCILSWMAFYWLSFNILFPARQPVAVIIGFAATLVVLLIIYQNWLPLLFKKSGRRQISANIKKSFKRVRSFDYRNAKNRRMILICSIGLIIGLVGWIIYQNHDTANQKNVQLLKDVKLLLNQGKNTKAYFLITEFYDRLSRQEKEEADTILKYLRNPHTPLLEVYGSHINWSPDGKRIYYRNEIDEIIILDWLNNEDINLTKLFNITETEDNPLFNKDGSQIILPSRYSTKYVVNLEKLDLDSLNSSWKTGFSRDGRHLYFNHNDKLFVKDLKDGNIISKSYNLEEDSWVGDWIVAINDTLLVYRGKDNINIYNPYLKNDSLMGGVVRKIPVDGYRYLQSGSSDPKYIISDVGLINWTTGEFIKFDEGSRIINNRVEDVKMENYKTYSDSIKEKRLADFDLVSKKIGKKEFRGLDSELTGLDFYVDPSFSFLLMQGYRRITIFYMGDNPKDKFKGFKLDEREIEKYR